MIHKCRHREELARGDPRRFTSTSFLRDSIALARDNLSDIIGLNIVVQCESCASLRGDSLNERSSVSRVSVPTSR